MMHSHAHALQSDVLLYGAMDMKHQQDRQSLKGSSNNQKKRQSKNKKNGKQKVNAVENGQYQIFTTLHGYAMTGPFPSGQDVWYCDHKKCQYTQYGVFRRYKIERWRSSKFGKKFTLCDGCVRQYKRPNPNQLQKNPSTVNVKLNINGAYPMQPAAIPLQQQQR